MLTEEMLCNGTLLGICSKLKEANLTDDVVVCLGSAAGLMCLSNQFTTRKVYVYTDLDEAQLPPQVEKVNVDYHNKDTVKVQGFTCTSATQTILDLLEFTEDIGNQDLYESLWMYYTTHGDSFAELVSLLNSRQKATFQIYEEDAIHYKDER